MRIYESLRLVRRRRIYPPLEDSCKIQVTAAMNELTEEIAALIEKLEKSNPIDGSTEQIATRHLRGLLAAIRNAERPAAQACRFADLEQFWLFSVDWCSQLSKELEKIIIMHQELL